MLNANLKCYIFKLLFDSYLFFTDYKQHKSIIWRSSLVGKERTELLSANLRDTDGIFADIATKRIYWTDA